MLITFKSFTFTITKRILFDISVIFFELLRVIDLTLFIASYLAARPEAEQFVFKIASNSAAVLLLLLLKSY